jgi:hypothetical protein
MRFSGLSRIELARRLGSDYPFRRVTEGDKEIRVRQLFRFADALEVKPLEVFRLALSDDDPPSPLLLRLIQEKERLKSLLDALDNQPPQQLAGDTQAPSAQPRREQEVGRDKPRPPTGPAGRQQASSGLDVARRDRRLKGAAGVFEALLARAWELRFDDPPTMLHLTELACYLASRLSGDGFSAAEVADLEARAWGEHANALRVIMRLVEAEQALRRAVAHWKLGSRNRRIAVRLKDLGASLLAFQRERAAAIELLKSVHSDYLGLGDQTRAISALIKQATYVGHGGDPGSAARLLQEAMGLLDAAPDAELKAIGMHARIWFLAEAGQLREAQAALAEHRPWLAAYSNFGRVNGAKLAHLEGHINAGLGELEPAEQSLRWARDQLAGDELKGQRGLVSLELSAVLLLQGRTGEACSLAAEVARTLSALGMPEEATRALGVLRDAIAHQALTVALVQSVISFLRRIEHTPEARFEPRDS